MPLVVDTSAWARQREPSVVERWVATMEADLFVSCPVAALEIAGSARDEAQYEAVAAYLAGLRQAPVTASACAAALGASRDLHGSRRMPAADYLIAASAAELGYGVLNEDGHFDVLSAVLGFASVRLSEPERAARGFRLPPHGSRGGRRT